MQSYNDAITPKLGKQKLLVEIILQDFNKMNKFADETYGNSDAFYNGYFKDEDCNRLQRNVSQHYVPMEGHVFSDRLPNDTDENGNVFCNARHAYKHNDPKRLCNDLSNDIYDPVEVGYNFMNRLASDTYENGNIYNPHKDNYYKELKRKVSEDAYVSMDSFSRCLDENSIQNPSQTLAPLAPPDTNIPIVYITGENSVYKKEIVKKNKEICVKERMSNKNPINKKQPRPLSEGFDQILSLEPDPESTKMSYSEIYDVPNTRAILPPKMQRNKESVFRSRSNACVSQNMRTYLKETKSADF